MNDALFVVAKNFSLSLIVKNIVNYQSRANYSILLGNLHRDMKKSQGQLNQNQL